MGDDDTEAPSPGAPRDASAAPAKKARRRKYVSCLRHLKASLNGLDSPFNIVVLLPSLFVIEAYRYSDGLHPLLDSHPTMRHGDISADIPEMDTTTWFFLMLAGSILLVAVGVTVFAWTTYLFHEANGTMAWEDPPHELVITGPYQHVRNPMALGLILILLGEAILFGLKGMFLYALAYLLYCVVWMDPRERRHNVERFGERATEYHVHVPGFLPRLEPFNSALMLA